MSSDTGIAGDNEGAFSFADDPEAASAGCNGGCDRGQSEAPGLGLALVFGLALRRRRGAASSLIVDTSVEGAA